MEVSLRKILTENGGNGITENSLIHRLFYASYDKEITRESRDSLLRKLYKNINEIASHIDSSASDKEILNALEREIFARIRYKRNSIYSVDFGSEHSRANCVGYASIFVSCLDYIGRKDLLDRISVKSDDDHTWLEFNLGKNRYEFNGQGRYSPKAYDLGYLELLNANASGCEFVRTADYGKALSIFGKLGLSKNGSNLGKRNLEVLLLRISEALCGNASGMDRLPLTNPQCTEQAIELNLKLRARSLAVSIQNPYSVTFEGSSGYIEVPNRLKPYYEQALSDTNNFLQRSLRSADSYKNTTSNWDSFVPNPPTPRYRKGYDVGERIGAVAGTYDAYLDRESKGPWFSEGNPKPPLPLTDFNVGYARGIQNGYGYANSLVSDENIKRLKRMFQDHKDVLDGKYF